MLAGAARARAALDGRDYVIPDDVKALAPAVLRHRVLLSAAAEIEGRPVEERDRPADRGDRGAALIYPTRRAILRGRGGRAGWRWLIGVCAPGLLDGGLGLLALLLAAGAASMR